MSETQTFDAWCIIDLFGHQRLAGRVTEQAIGGCSFIRVDIPASDSEPAFTRFFGQGAIYSMSPVSEEVARGFAQGHRPAPVSVYDMPRALPAPEPSFRAKQTVEFAHTDPGAMF